MSGSEKNRTRAMLVQVVMGLSVAGLICAGATVLYLRTTMHTLDVQAHSFSTEEARDAGCWKAYGTIEGPDVVLTCIIPDSPEYEGPPCGVLAQTLTPYLDGGTGRVRVQRLTQYPSGRVQCEDRLGQVADGG